MTTLMRNSNKNSKLKSKLILMPDIKPYVVNKILKIANRIPKKKKKKKAIKL